MCNFVLPPLLIRADGGERIGMGHVMRSLALAEAWRGIGAAVVFRGRGLTDSVRVRLDAAGIRWAPVGDDCTGPEDLRDTSNELSGLVAAHGRAPYALLDGYHFDAAYPRALRDAGARVIVMDDTAALPSYTADIVLNQNAGAEELEYGANPEAVLLQGSRYALIRREFLAAGTAPPVYPERARHLLVSFGGSDPADLTRRVLNVMGAAGGELRITVLVGPAYPRADELTSAVAVLGPFVSVRRDPEDLPKLMASADLAVTAGGSSCLEFAHLGIPMVVLQAADNQRGLARGLERAGAALNLGWHSDVSDAAIAGAVTALLGDAPRRRAMGEVGRRLVDGEGFRRVLEVVVALEAPSLRDTDLAIRTAAMEDVRQIWRLANDPDLRANSFDRPVLPLADHLPWYERRLVDPGCLFLLMDIGGAVVAQVRYERNADVAEVHFAVSSAFRGKGLGTRALADTWETACERLGVRRIRGVVLQGNSGSVRAFERAGYTAAREAQLRGFPCYVFEKSC